MWEQVVGQEHAVEVLRRAARRPGHAYLLVGPTGSGVEDAARCFAAELVAPDGDERARSLVLRGVHPDVVEFEPSGTSYRVKDDVRDRILPEASRAPVEAARKVLVIFEADRLKGNQHEPANALLKTIEEPPPRTVVLLVTGTPDDLLPTVRSRCQRIDLAAVGDAELQAALEAEGVEPARAALAVALAGGRLARARALAGPLHALRAEFASAPGRVDGTGATAARLADALDAVVEEAAAEVAKAHAAELEELDREMERAGYSDRDARRLRSRLEQRHRREARRVRTDLLEEGVAAIESRYRDALAAPASARNTDLSTLSLGARACADALDVCHDARDAFAVNEKGTLHLQHLLLRLPTPG